MRRPLLKQYSDLTSTDFKRHPVWVDCHSTDYGKPWYSDTTEETFRQWVGPFPADPSEGGIFLVCADFQLSDGTICAGFVTPARRLNDLGTIQPQMFVARRRFSFWGGLFGIPAEERRKFYTAIKRSAKAIFPIRFWALDGLTKGIALGWVEGFYRKAGVNGFTLEQ
jgi:hypothetical protein